MNRFHDECVYVHLGAVLSALKCGQLNNSRHWNFIERTKKKEKSMNYFPAVLPIVELVGALRESGNVKHTGRTTISSEFSVVR